MKKSIGGLVVCLLGLVACNVEHYDDCDEDGFDDGDAFGGSHSRAGTGSTSGKAGSTSPSAGTAAGGSDATAGGTGSAGTAAAASGGEGGDPVVVPPDPCDKERDCAPGYNCNLEQHECQPAAEETCGELETEAACTHRSDCTPIYGGTNCSCGQDCECKGGEPGCVCQSFQFFVCEATPQ
jgi:hypothetical protein